MNWPLCRVAAGSQFCILQEHGHKFRLRPITSGDENLIVIDRGGSARKEVAERFYPVRSLYRTLVKKKSSRQNYSEGKERKVKIIDAIYNTTGRDLRDVSPKIRRAVRRTSEKQLWRDYRATLQTEHTLSTAESSFHCSSAVRNRWVLPSRRIFLSPSVFHYCFYSASGKFVKSSAANGALGDIAETKMSSSKWCQENSHQISEKSHAEFWDELRKTRSHKNTRDILSARHSWLIHVENRK